MEHEVFMTEEKAIEFVRKQTSVFSVDEELYATVLAGDRASVDGAANRVLRVESRVSEHSVIVKQVLPFIRAAKEQGEHLPVSIDRLQTEVQYMQVAEKISAAISPELYYWDQESGTLIMEDLRRMKILRYELMAGRKFPRFSEEMGYFLGGIAFITSDLYLDPWEKRSLEEYFNHANTKPLWGKFMFDDNVLANRENPINPLVRTWVDQLNRDEAVRREVRGLKSMFNQQHQCLIHTDLHTSNIFVSEEELKVFDSEFARFGPIGFDLGRLIGSLALNFASLLGFSEWEEAKRKDYQAYLLDSIQTLYESFDETYKSLWEEHQPKRNEPKQRMRKMIFQQTLGFAACTMMARIYDGGLCYDFKRMERLEDRAKGQRFVIEMAKRLFIRRYEYGDMAEVIEDMRELSLHRSQVWE